MVSRSLWLAPPLIALGAWTAAGSLRAPPAEIAPLTLPACELRGCPTARTPASAAVERTAPLEAARVAALPTDVAAPAVEAGTAEPERPRLSQLEGEAVARRYFDAVVDVERWQARLPEGQTVDECTPESFPGLFAAIARREEIAPRMGDIADFAPGDALPWIDVYGQETHIAQAYRHLSRADRLFETWRLDRAIAAESARRMDERFERGAFERRPSQVGSVFG